MGSTHLFQDDQSHECATAILLEYLAPILVLLVGVLSCDIASAGNSLSGVAPSVGAALWWWELSAALHGRVRAGATLGVFGVGRLLRRVLAHLARSLPDVTAPTTTLVWGLAFASLFWLLVLGPLPIMSLLGTPRQPRPSLSLAVVSTIIPFAAFLVALRHIPPDECDDHPPRLNRHGWTWAFACSESPLSGTQILGGRFVIAAIVIVQTAGLRSRPLPPQE